MDPGVFAIRADVTETREAKRVCQLKCPAKAECLSWAIIYQETGVWGGYLESERQYIGDDIRERLMECAFTEGVLVEKIVKDPAGVEMLAEIKARHAPRRKNEEHWPMAA